jgi:hypothetical protein
VAREWVRTRELRDFLQLVRRGVDVASRVRGVKPPKTSGVTFGDIWPSMKVIGEKEVKVV